MNVIYILKDKELNEYLVIKSSKDDFDFFSSDECKAFDVTAVLKTKVGLLDHFEGRLGHETIIVSKRYRIISATILGIL